MSLQFLKKKVKREHATTKAFNYEKDGVTLAFTLRVDTKTQLQTFEELLVEALTEVRDEITK